MSLNYLLKFYALLISQIQAIDSIIMKGFEEKFVWKFCVR
jgi:hypothetical protein